MREKSETETKVTICSRQSHVRSYCEGFFTCLFLVLVAAVLYFFFVVYDTTQAADVDDYKERVDTCVRTMIANLKTWNYVSFISVLFIIIVLK